jgi:hypothetical protein
MPHECPVCGKSFRYKAWMRKHHVMHEQAPKHACTQCGREFKSTAALRTHVRTRHEEGYRYVCTVCRKGYQDRRKLESHYHRHARQVLFFFFFSPLSFFFLFFFPLPFSSCADKATRPCAVRSATPWNVFAMWVV